MKITKHGTEYNKEERSGEDFVCANCGCEFSVKKDEYHIDIGGANPQCEGISLTYTVNNVRSDYLVCSCPECHKIVRKIEDHITSVTINCETTQHTSSVTPV